MEEVFGAFITLFVIIDPIGNLPLVMTITKGMPAKEIKKNVDRSIFVASVLLFAFLFLGLQIFDFLSINLESFQIGGGIILLIIGISYVFGVSGHFVKKHGGDLIVPVGTPLLTGPGAIMTTLILVREQGILVTVIAAFFALFASWIILINSLKIYKILGESWTNVISRIMGIILVSIAVNLMIKGILDVFASVAY